VCIVGRSFCLLGTEIGNRKSGRKQESISEFRIPNSEFRFLPFISAFHRLTTVMKLHTGDTVVIISGKDKGKTGNILRVLPSTHRVVVSDINMRTKHIRALPNRPGQIVRYEASIAVSNVMLVDPESKKRTRVGFALDEKGKKSRIAKRSGKTVVAAKEQKITRKEADASTAPSTGESEETKESEEKKVEKKVSKEKKEKKDKKEKKVERVDAPEKTAFWKKMGFGTEAMDEEAQQQSDAKPKSDHTVPDQGKTPDTFTHQRGS